MAEFVRAITATEAVIKTASVEVKTLTINGKQMTQSVFRQIQQGPLIDPDTLDFIGTPWGKVNYYWGECKPDHLHIVWQHGSELRRDCVYPEWPMRYRTSADNTQAAERCRVGAYAVILLTAYRKAVPYLEDQMRVRFPLRTWTINRGSEVVSAARKKWDFLHTGDMADYQGYVTKTVWKDGKSLSVPVPPEEARLAITDHLQQVIKAALHKQLRWLGGLVPDYNYDWTVPDTLTVQTIIDACTTADATHHRLLDRLSWAPQKWAAAYALLQASDHLFIAV